MLRIDAHHHYWRYQPQDYPWIDDDMPQLRRDFYPRSSSLCWRSTGSMVRW